MFFDTMSDFNVPGSRPKKHNEISEIDRTVCRSYEFWALLAICLSIYPSIYLAIYNMCIYIYNDNDNDSNNDNTNSSSNTAAALRRESFRQAIVTKIDLDLEVDFARQVIISIIVIIIISSSSMMITTTSSRSSFIIVIIVSIIVTTST